MTEQTLSKNLRELRLSLRLSQIEMSKKLGIGEKMYQLYESGKYDNVKTETVRRKKFLDKIEEVKSNAANDKPKSPATSNSPDLEKKNQELQNENSELKNKVIALHERLDRKREQFEKHIERRMDKMLAAVLTEKKN